MDNEKQQDQFSSQQSNSSYGPLIGSIIIIFIVIAGGIYFFKNAKENINTPENYSPEVEEIVTDLDDTDLENLDEELKAIEAEIEAEIKLQN